MSFKRRIAKPPPFTEWHGNTYRAKIRIPEELRHLFPVMERGRPSAKTSLKRFLYKDLQTDDPDEAAVAATVFVAKMRKRFRRMGRQDGKLSELRPEVLRWRKAIETSPNSNIFSQAQTQNAAPITAEELMALETAPVYSEADALVDRAYEIENTRGHARAMSFFNLASGRTRLISEAMEGWLQSEKYSDATRKRYRKVVEALIEWCKDHRILPVIEEIDSKRANRFLSNHPSRQTKASDNERAALSRLWHWSNTKLMSDLKLNLEGHEVWIGDLGENPWRRIGAQKSSKPR